MERVQRFTPAWPGEMPVRHLYTVGLAGERFLREIRDNERFLAARCAQCRYAYLPPRLYCQRCFRKLDDWVEVGPQGTVRAHTVARLDLDGQPLEAPHMFALIQLDGADGLLLHRLAGVTPETVRPGLRVRPVFRERRERKGSILDIEHFRRA